MSVFGAAKVSHFEILCRFHGFQPSVNCFCAFYTISYTKEWMSFIKRSDVAPVCHSKPLDFVKNWNDHFFWVDSTAFPLFVSLKSKILSKDPPPKLSQYGTKACDFLRTHTSPFRKFPEPFLCLVGIIRYYTLDENVIQRFGMMKRVEMDLSAFIRHSDPTKVRIRERDLAKREEHSVERDDDVLEEIVAKGASEVVAEKTKKKRKRKSLATTRELVPDGSSVPSGVTRPPTVVSVSPRPDDGPTDSVSGPNLRTCPPALRSLAKDAHVPTVAVTTTVTANASIVPPPMVRVVSKNLEIVANSTSTGGVNANVAGTSKLNELVDSSDSFYASQDLDSDTLHHIYIPKWNVTNDSVLDDPYVCRDLTGRLALPDLFAQLRAMDYDQLYSEFNVKAARHVCLGAEVRMQAEHTLERKCELEDKCVEQAALLLERDAEIVHLKSLLSLKEAEAVKAIRLRGQLTVVEVADAAKGGKLRDLKKKNFALEGERDVMSEKIATLESANVAKELPWNLKGIVLSLRKTHWSLPLSSLKNAWRPFRMSRQRFWVIGLRSWMLSCRKWLSILTKNFILASLPPYSDGDEANYIDDVNVLCAVHFSLLSELESKKDSYIVDLMDSLRLEDDVVIGETSLSSSLQVVHLRVQRFRGEVKEKRVLLTDVITPLVEPLSSKSLTGEASTSAAPITTLSTTFASSDVVLPTSVVNDQVLDAEPHNEDPSTVIFEKEELGTSLE
nr:hypothetical protein [Tanacetum cinerariifolium]